MAARQENVVISCENIQKTYLLGTEGVTALRGVSLDVMEGEFLVIYGTSGGGKTTLLNILGTIDQPTKGNLAVMGNRLTARTPDSVVADLRLHDMGFVFQTFNLLSTMTAAENVQIPMVLSGRMSLSDQKQKVRDLLESVGMSERADHYPSMLSGGEQQRVTIARAMANTPKVLLLDEPTGDLDTKNTKIVIDLLMKLNRDHGVTLVMVTHDPEMKSFAHRAVYVQDGKIGRLETIPVAERDRAMEDLRTDLREGGAEPGGIESGLVRQRGVGGGNSRQPADYSSQISCNEGAEPDSCAALTEVRNPSDYATFCPEALRLNTEGRASAAAAHSLFAGGPHQHQSPFQSPATLRPQAIEVEMNTMGGNAI
eukprot:gene2926-4597_t